MANLYPPPEFYIKPQIEQALREDFGHGFDLTSQTAIPENMNACVHLVARQDLVLCGIEWGKIALYMIDAKLDIEFHAQDADYISKGTVIAKISGNARAIMSAERVVLNFMGHLSGIATLTHKFAQKIIDTPAKVTCTRKTLPNLRTAQKYAVRCGGGISHRSGLDDAVLIKDNHIGVCGSVKKAIAYARESIGHTVKIEIECDYFEQFQHAFEARADVIMLDNMTPEQIEQCVLYQIDARKDKGIILEASGGVTLDTILGIAQTGVDVISVGGLTHSAPNADLAFDFISLK